MGLEIFKRENELDQGIAIEECKKRIIEICKQQKYIDQQFKVLERDFISVNKSDLTKFLTEELKFIANPNGKEIIYSFETEGKKYTITIDFNDFDALSVVKLYIDSSVFPYTFNCEYKNLNISKLNWEFEDILYGNSELRRTDRTAIQQNKKYWNNELKIAEESYNNNNKLFLEAKNLNNDERFYIEVTDKYETEKKYKNLVEFIRSVLESVN